MARRVLLVVSVVAVVAAGVLGMSGAGGVGSVQARWLAVPLSGTNSTAHAINNRGQIVGNVSFGTCYQAALWEKGKIRDLGTLGGECSIATGINDRGQVVGWSLKKDENWKTMHAFLWENGKMRDLNAGITPPRTQARQTDRRRLLRGPRRSLAPLRHRSDWKGDPGRDRAIARRVEGPLG